MRVLILILVFFERCDDLLDIASIEDSRSSSQNAVKLWPSHCVVSCVPAVPLLIKGYQWVHVLVGVLWWLGCI